MDCWRSGLLGLESGGGTATSEAGLAASLMGGSKTSIPGFKGEWRAEPTVESSSMAESLDDEGTGLSFSSAKRSIDARLAVSEGTSLAIIDASVDEAPAAPAAAAANAPEELMREEASPWTELSTCTLRLARGSAKGE